MTSNTNKWNLDLDELLLLGQEVGNELERLNNSGIRAAQGGMNSLQDLIGSLQPLLLTRFREC
jgi:hypothetical protein